MKKTAIFLLILCGLLLNNSSRADITNFHPEGYFTNPVNTKYGIIASNDLQTSLYLIHNGSFEVLLSAPGCGRYFTIDKSGSKIGFKLIDPETGLQTPAIYDLEKRKVVMLSEAVQNAGQVSFADNGTIAYTLGNQLYLRNGETLNHYDLGVYSNRTPVSPDGTKVIFRDDNDQLWIFDISGNIRYNITDNKMGYCNALWSPDGKFIAFTSNGMDVFTYDINSKSTYSIGQGENPQWAPDSRSIVFYRRDIDFNKVVLVNSDIFVSSFDGSSIKNITNTPAINEMDACFDRTSNEIIYDTYSAGEIRKLNAGNSLEKSQPGNSDLLYKLEIPLKNKTFEIKSSQNKLSKAGSTTQAMQWIHVHQVWDTRDNGNWKAVAEGYNACGATTAIELLASYGILKPWPMITYGHNSDYGLYDSDPYTFNNITYNNFTYWIAGAHGYMWNNGGSPYSHIVQFLKNHGVSNATQVDAPTWSQMSQELDSGPYIFCSTGLTAAHIVLVYARYGNTHTVIADDPYGDKNVGSYGQINNGANAIYDWSDGNTGHQLITPAAWGVAVKYTPAASPSVSSFSPASASDSVSVFASVSVTFSHQMDMASTEKAFSITPSVAGSLTWSNYNLTMTFKPDNSFAKATKYTVKIDTSAKSFWNKSLAAGTSFSFVTKSRDRLNIVQLYPQKNQQDISTTVQFKVAYDAKVNSYSGALSFTDSQGKSVSVSNIKLTTLSNNTSMLTFEPKNPLEYNTSYRLTFPGTFADAEGTSLRDTIVVDFKTQTEKHQDGSILDAFENPGQWNNPSYSGSTRGVDTALSKFTIAPERKRNGGSSGKIAYTFTQNDSGLCRVFNAAKPLAGPDNAIFGIWVFGDLSYNKLEYWFYDKNNQNVSVPIDTLNWSGWKFKEIPISQVPATGEKRFHSIVIRQNPKGSRTGEVYFDDMQTSSVTSVEDGKHNQSPEVYSLSQNYPNPFNPTTTINYSIAKPGMVRLSVYNSLGERIAVLVDRMQAEGNYSVRFEAGSFPSGIYFYKMEAGEYTSSKKLIILK